MKKLTNPFPPGPSGSYFPLELNEFSDARVRKLIKDYGLSGLGMHLLTLHFLSIQPDLCVEISVAEEYLQGFRVGRQKLMFNELLHNYNLYTVQGDYFFSQKVDAIMRPLTNKRTRTVQKGQKEADSSTDEVQPWAFPKSAVDRSEPNPYPNGAVGEYYPLCSNELNDLRVLDYFGDAGLIGVGIYLATQVFLSVQPDHTARITAMSKHVKRFLASKQKWTFDEMINDYDLYISDGKQFYSQRVDAVMEPLQLKRARVAQRHREEQADADQPMRPAAERDGEKDAEPYPNHDHNQPDNYAYEEDKRKLDGNYLEVSQNFPNSNVSYTEVWAKDIQEWNELNNSQLNSSDSFSMQPGANEKQAPLYRIAEESKAENIENIESFNIKNNSFLYNKNTSSSGRGTKSEDADFDDKNESYFISTSQNAIINSINAANNSTNSIINSSNAANNSSSPTCNSQNTIGNCLLKNQNGQTEQNQICKAGQFSEQSQASKQSQGQIIEVVEVEEEEERFFEESLISEEEKTKKKKKGPSIPKWKKSFEALKKDKEWLVYFAEQTPDPNFFLTNMDEILKDFHNTIICYGKEKEIKNLKAAKKYFRNRYCKGSPLMNRYKNKFELLLNPLHYERIDRATGKRFTTSGSLIPDEAPAYPGPPYRRYDKWRREWK